MNGGPASFDNAPVVKALFFTTAGSSILWQAARFDIVEPLHPVLRTFVQNFVFQNTGELVFGVALLYCFRTLERQTGSAKFGGYAAIVTSLSYGLQVAIQAAYNFKSIPAGPYGFIFASFLQFIFDIPPSRRFSVLGIPLSDKVFTYLAGLQLIFSNGTGSMMAAMCGILAGFTYRSNIFRIRKFRFPSFVNRLLGQTIGRLINGNSPSPVITMQTARHNRRRGQLQPNHRTAGQPPTRENTAASPDAIRQLASMGFNESQARRALQATNNDVQSAIAMLVDQA